MDEISTDAAPASIGPFSQGISDGSNVYVSGQGPIDPETGDVVGDDIRTQTARTLDNVDAVLKAGGLSLEDVVKATVFLTDVADYDDVNDVYADYVTRPFPARSAVQVSALPIDIRVEIEVVATY